MQTDKTIWLVIVQSDALLPDVTVHSTSEKALEKLRWEVAEAYEDTAGFEWSPEVPDPTGMDYFDMVEWFETWSHDARVDIVTVDIDD